MSSFYEITDGIPYAYELPAQATAGDTGTTVIGSFSAPSDGTVVRVDLVPRAAVTANATNFAAYNLQNKGVQGNGTTVVATRTWAAGSSVAGTKESVGLHATPANREMKAGDQLQLVRSVGGTGLATPAMSWVIHFLPRR